MNGIKGRVALLAAAALAAGAGMPYLSRPVRQYKSAHKMSDADLEAIAKAEEKRQRKLARNRSR